MKNPLLVPELCDVLATQDLDAIREFCAEAHPAVVAELISALDPAETWEVLKLIELPLRADIFSHLDEDVQVDIVARLPRKEVALLVTDMPPDDRADLFKRLPEKTRDLVLPVLAQAEREDIRRLSAYTEGTAGSVMTSEYATLPPGITIARAIEHLREVAPDKETIYYAYVVGPDRKLLGFVSLKDLILARREALVSDIMHEEVIFARVGDDQEEAARLIQKYDLIALPVVNGGEALVGIITHDDALDIVTQEHTEDMEKLMAIAGSHETANYMKTPAWRHFKNRAGWVAGLGVLGLVSGFIVQGFEDMLMQFAILAVFMPMLADTGGNTGSQASTLVVRALAVREIVPRDVARVLAKEFQVALMLALMLGGMAYGRVVLFGGGSTIPDGYSLGRIGVAIAIALSLQVVTSTLIGALLPLGAAKLKFDPAVVASPALTTIVDITGLLLFFGTVKLVLGL